MKNKISFWQAQKQADNITQCIVITPFVLFTHGFFCINSIHISGNYLGAILLGIIGLMIASFLVSRPYLFSYTHIGRILSVNLNENLIHISLEKSKTFLCQKEGGIVIYKNEKRVTIPYSPDYTVEDGETISWNSIKYYGMLYVAKSKSPVLC